MKKKYRIVPSEIGKYYKVECWRWYFPFWVNIAYWRDFETVDEAKTFIIQMENPIYF
ncbi:hypothetical protein [uncultured Butyricimonas sp.]|uniref:hypothetical protein n=1 Tax=uncultured Butyricimonas sp. TaxID=1268785 RepID=UPI0026DB4BBB|nr:hypothetical protein [uncultured Butyricimonas sp.]